MNQDSPLFRAYNLVHGDRGESYGEQAQDMDGLATLWSVILGHTITGEQAALCLMALKMNRQAHNLRIGKFHLDSNDDTAGYVEVLALVHQQHEKALKKPGIYGEPWGRTCIHEEGYVHGSTDTCSCRCATCSLLPAPMMHEREPIKVWPSRIDP